MVNPPISPFTLDNTDYLSLDRIAEGKPGFHSIYWDIPDTADDIFKSTDHGSVLNGKLTKHTVRLKWNTAQLQRRKAGNRVQVKCHADNGVDGSPLEYPVLLIIECMLNIYVVKKIS